MSKRKTLSLPKKVAIELKRQSRLAFLYRNASSRFPHNARQHANFPFIKSSFDFQPRSPFKSHPITTLLRSGPSLILNKTRFSGPVLLSQPTLKIKQAHSLATAKLHTPQSALLIQTDNALLRLCVGDKRSNNEERIGPSHADNMPGLQGGPPPS
jgi:hypothetical protein